jgi:uncharacterized membrane protein
MKMHWSVLIFFFDGLLFILVSIPLRFGKVPPNPVYGIRIPKAYESTDLWYRINAAGATVMIIYGTIILIVGGILLTLRSRSGVGLDPVVALIVNLVLCLTTIVNVLFVCSRVGRITNKI